MKANFTEFVTNLSIRDSATVFRRAVDSRPLKLKAARFDYFTPAEEGKPFDTVHDGRKPDFEVGAGYRLGELTGTVLLSCLSLEEGRTLVSLRSTGNMRGRLFTNSLSKHILERFNKLDQSIDPDRYSERR